MKGIIHIFTLLLMVSLPSTSIAFGRTKVVVRQGDDYVKVFATANAQYIIKDNIDLGGQTVKVGAGSVLHFKGGSLSNGVILGNRTIVKAKNYEIFKRGYTRFRAYVKAGVKESVPPSLIIQHHNCLFIEGTWNNKTCKSKWTGLLNDSQEDVMLAVRNYVVLYADGAKVVLPTFNSFGYESIKLPGNHYIDFNNSSISYPDDLSIWEDKTILLPEGSKPNPPESGYGLLSLSSNIRISNLTIDGKSSYRSSEKIRLGVSCIISIGNAQNVVIEKINLNNVLGPGMTAQSGAKDIKFKNCKFYNIGEHILYSHQYLGFCHFENCIFDTWDSERLSQYRNGMNYVYKHTPPTDDKSKFNDIFKFDLQFNGCIFINPKRVNSQGRILGGFLTGGFPIVVKLNGCRFIGEYPPFNPGGGPETSDFMGKNSQMVVRNCDGSPYIYPSKSNYNIVALYYDCTNIAFRTTWTRRYENCKLTLDYYENNIENVSSSFEDEFQHPLEVIDCELVDKGGDVIVNHPVFHRPIIFKNCIFRSEVRRENISELISIKGAVDSISFINCNIELPNYHLVGGNGDLKKLSVNNSRLKGLKSTYQSIAIEKLELSDNIQL